MPAWLFYTILAGLTWGAYVPVLYYGIGELGGGANARLLAVLCVGVAYFVIGVIFPLSMFLTGQYVWPKASTPGLVFSGLAGVSGAGGAILLILAAIATNATGKQTSRCSSTLLFTDWLPSLLLSITSV